MCAGWRGVNAHARLVPFPGWNACASHRVEICFRQRIVSPCDPSQSTRIGTWGLTANQWFPLSCVCRDLETAIRAAAAVHSFSIRSRYSRVNANSGAIRNWQPRRLLDSQRPISAVRLCQSPVGDRRNSTIESRLPRVFEGARVYRHVGLDHDPVFEVSCRGIQLVAEVSDGKTVGCDDSAQFILRHR